MYFEIAPGHVWIGGGMYMPPSQHLRLVREHIGAHPRKFRSIVSARGFKRAVGRLDGTRLTRTPRGFPPDHPAADYLVFKQFLAGREYPASFATSPPFYSELLKVFRAITPLVRFLNAPLLGLAPRPEAFLHAEQARQTRT